MKNGSSYDTRFLVEMFYESEPERLDKIREILRRSKPNYLSTIVLSEFFRLTLEKEGNVVAELRSKSLMRDFRLINVDSEIAVQAAIIKCAENEIPFADSLIASTAKILKVPCYTDDPHFKSIEGVLVKWI